MDLLFENVFPILFDCLTVFKFGSTREVVSRFILSDEPSAGATAFDIFGLVSTFNCSSISLIIQFWRTKVMAHEAVLSKFPKKECKTSFCYNGRQWPGLVCLRYKLRDRKRSNLIFYLNQTMFDQSFIPQLTNLPPYNSSKRSKMLILNMCICHWFTFRKIVKDGQKIVAQFPKTHSLLARPHQE